MNIQFPLMLKVPNSKDFYSYYVPMSLLSIVKDGNDEYITHLDTESDEITTLESEDGQKISIKSLRCKTLTEFLIALDVHNLVHGFSIMNNESSVEKIKKFTTTIKELREENLLLKKKLKNIEKVFKQIKL